MNFRLSFPSGYEVEDIHDSNIDVYIMVDESDIFCATFFTLKNVQKLMNTNLSSQGNSAGLYFWASDMIIITSITLENIINTVKDLIVDGIVKDVCSTQDFDADSSDWLDLVEINT